MGYSIGIGEIIYTLDEDESEDTVSVSAREEDISDAPDLGHGDVSDKTNYRHPSYSGWHSFCFETKLLDVFYEDGGDFIGGHPGYVPLTKLQLERVREEKNNWIKTHPNTICPSTIKCPQENPYCDCECKVDFILGRLTWLEFWMDWALKNCKNPIIYNS